MGLGPFQMGIGGSIEDIEGTYRFQGEGMKYIQQWRCTWKIR